VLHPTYKHLDAKLRLGAFTVGQWAQIALAGAFAAVFAVYLSPLPPRVTIFVSILGAGLPVATSYGAMGLEFSLAQLVVSAWRYWRAPRRYLPGPGRSAVGYVVEVARPAETEAHAAADAEQAGREGEGLWDL
jgi:hypothetical protein